MKKIYYLYFILLPATLQAQNNSNQIFGSDYEFCNYLKIIPMGKLYSHSFEMRGFGMRLYFSKPNSKFINGVFLEGSVTSANFYGKDFKLSTNQLNQHTAEVYNDFCTFGWCGKLFLRNFQKSWLNPFFDYQAGFTRWVTDLYVKYPKDLPQMFTDFTVSFNVHAYAGFGILFRPALTKLENLGITFSEGRLIGGKVDYPDIQNMLATTSRQNFRTWHLGLTLLF
jgi:hypothetical protein